jgi:hypothetical protein
MGKLRVLNRTSTIPNSSLVQNWITRLDSVVVVEERETRAPSLTVKGSA